MVPKIAFLFLTISNVFHEPTWVKFFSGHEGNYSLYVHPKQDVKRDSFFARAVISERAETRWENILNAQRALLREALKDQTNTKFVFLSESDIPIKTFEEAYQRILEHPYSEFSYWRNQNHPHRKLPNLANMHKNTAWIILNRKHAQLMVDDTTMSTLFAQFPFDCEHYASTFLAHNNLLDEVVNDSATLDIWPDGGPHPHFFDAPLENDPFRDMLISAISGKWYVFCRKFSPKCNLDFLHPYNPELF